MDARRASLAVPKVRHVGFFAPNPNQSPSQNPRPPSRSQSVPAESNSPALSDSPASGNSLSPVMIPPPRHHSENLAQLRSAAVPVPDAISRRTTAREHVAVVGSYNPGESVLGEALSPNFSEDNSEASTTLEGFSRSGSGKLAASSSLPSGGFEIIAAKSGKLTGLDREKQAAAPTPEKIRGTAVEVQNVIASSSKPMKEKTTKAERRALQESQRAAKAAAKAKGNKSAAGSGLAAPAKPLKQPSKKKDDPPQKKDDPAPAPSVAGSDRKGIDRPDKERKKDVPPPRMQFDDKNRVNKAKRRAVVNRPEARNRVELFRHLPQYEHGTQLPELESKFFQLDPMHPAVYKVGMQYLAGDISGGNARCMAMLHAFQEAIKDYSTPPEKTFARDLAAKISSYVSFLIECRPLSMSMGNAIRFLKSHIAELPLTLSESEAKASLCKDIDRFINEKIILADKVIVRHASIKIRDGDVLLTYGSSCVVEMILLYAHELGKQFRVVVADSRPKLEGQALLRRLVAKGLSCTYTHINAVSYIMHEVTRVFLGASSILSNGTVYSRVGTACIAMVANAFRVPVLICCEAYKFHERVLLDSICSNELGDPNAIAKVPGRMYAGNLDNQANKENLQHLNLMYDATPSDYISMIITDYGMIPATSVPVIVREYRREHLLI